MPDNLEIKSFGAFEIKDESKGEVCAIVATLNCVDKDGDVMLPGSIPDGVKVKLSAYNHDIITDSAPPVGIGELSIKGDKAMFNGRFFLSTERGREAFATVKEMGIDGEWSFGFVRNQTKTAPMTSEWKAKGARRLVAGVTAVEASPVFIGAGMGTATVYTKSATEVLEDPAIEAARIKAEEDAEALRAATERKALADAASVELNAKADRMFARAKVGAR